MDARAVAALTALLLAMPMAALAQSGSEGGGGWGGSGEGYPPPYRNSPDPAPPCCPEPEDQEAWRACNANVTTEAGHWECRSDYCSTHADGHCAYYCWKYLDPACPDPEPRTGNATATRTETAPPATSDGPASPREGNGTADPCDRARDPGRCRAECDAPTPPPRCQGNATRPTRTESQAPAPKPAKELPGEPRSGRFVQYTLRGDGTGVSGLQVAGLDAVRQVQVQGARSLRVLENGEVLRIRGDDAKLEVHDQPGGFLSFQGQGNVSLRIELPSDATISLNERGATVGYPDGHRAILLYDNGTWQGKQLVVHEFVSYHLAELESHRGDDERKIEVQQAVERRAVAAEIEIAPGADAQVRAYDDVAVEVQVPAAGGAVRVQIGSNLTEGRTIVLNVDPGMLASVDPERLELRYYDVNDDGTETEVVFKRASDLADILDPSNDAGQPEYYVVSDAQGLQVMVSVPHWSTHAVTLSSLAELAQPRVLVGILVGLGGIAVAAVALFWPRRD